MDVFWFIYFVDKLSLDEWGSGGQISGDRKFFIRRLNVCKNDQEIESLIFQEVKSFNNIWQFFSGGWKNDQEVES